jgi:hypothetical protein
METIGVPDLVVDPRCMNEEEILCAIDLAYRERLALRQKLEVRMPLVKQTIQNVLRDLDLTTHEQAVNVMPAANAQSEF